MMQFQSNHKLLAAHSSHSWLRQHKRIWLTLLLIVGMLAAVVLLLFWQAESTAASYTKATHTYAQTIEADLKQESDKIKAISPTGVAQLQAELTTLQAQLKKHTSEEPKLGQSWFASSLSNTYRSAQVKANKVQATTTELVSTIAKLKSLTDYNKAVSEVLAPLGAKASLTSSELGTQEKLWQDASTKLHAITPPVELKDAHTQLMNACQTVAPLWKSLSDAYQKTDISGFNKVKDEIDKQFAALRSQAASFTKVANTINDKLTADVQQLQRL